jgi:cyclopropane-fatty-acyl-phospholipid synthase
VGFLGSGPPSTQRLLDTIGAALPDVHLRAYDGCESGPPTAPTRITIESPRALVRIARAPRGLGLARAWVAGDISVSGDVRRLAEGESTLYSAKSLGPVLLTSLRTAAALGPREFRASGPTRVEYRARRPGKHTVDRDLAEVDFHYGLSPEFYRLLLGPSLTYSGAMFEPGLTLEQAQTRKHETVCRKLGLDGESRVLDIGCGWGSFLMTAAGTFGSAGVGFTASRAQQEEAAKRLAGFERVSVRYGDYRQLLPLQRDITAVASIGMYEHVGEENSAAFFRLVRSRLPRGARYLNQAITRRESGPRRFRSNSFAQRFIFPNGQLLPLSQQLRDLETAGFRVLSVENFGPSYAATIGHWMDHLEEHWDTAVELEGPERVRAWQLYLAGSRRRFLDGTIDVTQVLTEAR